MSSVGPSDNSAPQHPVAARGTPGGQRAPVVCLCGAPRARAEMSAARMDLALAGNVVLSPEFADHAGEKALTREQRAVLGAVERAKIELAGRVVVVNPGGCVEDPAADALAYALERGKAVQFTEPVVSMSLKAEHYAALECGAKRVEVRLLDAKREGLRALHVVRFVCGPRSVLARITGLRRFEDRGALLRGIDPALVVPGADRDALARIVESLYPGRAGDPMIALTLQVLGVLGADVGPGAPETLLGTAALDIVDRAGGERVVPGTPGDVRRVACPAALARVITASALVCTDSAGRVLLVRATYPGARGAVWEVPGGSRDAVDGFPRDTARREAREELGLDGIEPGALLCVDFVPPAGPRELPLVAHLYDAGTLSQAQVAAIRLAAGELSEFAFVDVEEITGMVSESLRRRLVWAVRSLRGGWGTVELEDGRVRGEEGIVARDGLRPLFTWHETPVPEGLAVTQVYGWLIDPQDGRVLLQERAAEGLYNLPGGRPEPCDGGDPLRTLVREALEESQVHIDVDRAVYLGYQTVVGDAQRPYPYAQLRYAAPILRYEPIAPDPDTDGEMYRRYLTSFGHAPRLLDWGTHGHQQAEAAQRAGRAMGLPVDNPPPGGHLDHAHTPRSTSDRRTSAPIPPHASW